MVGMCFAFRWKAWASHEQLDIYIVSLAIVLHNCLKIVPVPSKLLHLFAGEHDKVAAELFTVTVLHDAVSGHLLCSHSSHPAVSPQLCHFNSCCDRVVNRTGTTFWGNCCCKTCCVGTYLESKAQAERCSSLWLFVPWQLEVEEAMAKILWMKEVKWGVKGESGKKSRSSKEAAESFKGKDRSERSVLSQSENSCGMKILVRVQPHSTPKGNCLG